MKSNTINQNDTAKRLADLPKNDSIPGYRRVAKFKGKIHSLSFFGSDKGRLAVHAGGELYSLPINEDRAVRLHPTAHIGDKESIAFSCGPIALLNGSDRLFALLPKGKPLELSADGRILGCRCAALCGGRIFLSGNPSLPGRVFYSSPIGDGEISFENGGEFTEGTGLVDVRALIPYGGYLWIFKATDDGSGGIVCRGMVEDGLPLIRTVSHGMICHAAAALGDGFVLLTERGVMKICSPLSEGGEKMTPISSPVVSLLCGEELCRARLCVCGSRPAVSVDERLYILDPDEGQWTVLSGVGGYKGDRRVYRYSAEPGDYATHPLTDKIAVGEIFSRRSADGEMVYYSAEEGGRYAVYPTEERVGGLLLPAENMLSDGQTLWFSDGEGSLYAFYGSTAPGEDDTADFTAKCSKNADTLYSFSGHRPKYITTEGVKFCFIPTEKKG